MVMAGKNAAYLDVVNILMITESSVRIVPGSSLPRNRMRRLLSIVLIWSTMISPSIPARKLFTLNGTFLIVLVSGMIVTVIIRWLIILFEITTHGLFFFVSCPIAGFN